MIPVLYQSYWLIIVLAFWVYQTGSCIRMVRASANAYKLKRFDYANAHHQHQHQTIHLSITTTINNIYLSTDLIFQITELKLNHNFFIGPINLYLNFRRLIWRSNPKKKHGKNVFYFCKVDVNLAGYCMHRRPYSFCRTESSISFGEGFDIDIDIDMRKESIAHQLCIFIGNIDITKRNWEFPQEVDDVFPILFFIYFQQFYLHLPWLQASDNFNIKNNWHTWKWRQVNYNQERVQRGALLPINTP